MTTTENAGHRGFYSDILSEEGEPDPKVRVAFV